MIIKNKKQTQMKKAQLKIQQMAFMLMAVTLFFVLIGLFVIGFKTAGLNKEATQLEAENAKLLVSKLADSPEFSCGEVFGTKRINCIDADKVMVLKDNPKYAGFWGVASIEIIKTYPKSDENKECTKINYPECNTIEVYSKNVNSEISASNFVSLCRKEVFEGEVYDKCELAELLVSYEVKK